MNRKEAIKILEHSGDYIGLLPSEFWDSDDGIGEAIDMAIETLKSERPKGEWVEYISDEYGVRYGRCTSCKESTLNAVFYDLNGQRHIMDFCPKCGADMREVVQRMNKQEAIKTLREWRGRMADHGVPDFGEKYKALGMAIEALQDDWIPVSERVPEVGEDVLASVHEDYAEHAVIINRYEEQPSWSNGLITAWKPLPEPYKGGDTE